MYIAEGCGDFGDGEVPQFIQPCKPPASARRLPGAATRPLRRPVSLTPSDGSGSTARLMGVSHHAANVRAIFLLLDCQSRP